MIMLLNWGLPDHRRCKPAIGNASVDLNLLSNAPAAFATGQTTQGHALSNPTQGHAVLPQPSVLMAAHSRRASMLKEDRKQRRTAICGRRYNTVMKLIFISATLTIIYYMRYERVVRVTYDKDRDTFRSWIMVLVSWLLAFLFHERIRGRGFLHYQVEVRLLLLSSPSTL